MPADSEATPRGRTRDLLTSAVSSPSGIPIRVAFDAVVLVAALALTWLLAPSGLPEADQAWQIWLLPPLTILALATRGMYRPPMGKRPLDVAALSALTTLTAAVAVLAVIGATNAGSGERELLLRAWLYSTILLAGGRSLVAAVRRSARQAGAFAKPALIVGAGEIGSRLEKRFRREPGMGVRIVGFLDSDPGPRASQSDAGARVMGSLEDLDRVVAETGAEHVVLAFGAPDEEQFLFARRCIDLGLDVSVVPRLFEVVNRNISVEHVGGYPLLRLQPVAHRGWQFTVKYTLGKLLAALVIVALSPVLIATALAVKLSSPGPVLFRQARVGIDGHRFEMLKFRSMRLPSGAEDGAAETDSPTQAPGGVEGEDRRTRVGIFIRTTSLDELPQLINVLKGDMTVVGPRPERPEFVKLFDESVRRYDDRLRVKAGITGWAQVNGLRGKGSIEDRLELDNFYIENWSLAFDAKILLMTLITPLSHRAE